MWNDVLIWIEAHQALAGWAQAFGAIVAVAVAIAVPARQHALATRREQASVRLAQRVLANAIVVDVTGLEAKIVGARTRLKAHAKVLIDQRQFDDFTVLKIVPPVALMQNVKRMHVLGEQAAIPLVQAITIARQYDELVHDLMEDLNRGRRQPREALPIFSSLTNYLDALDKLLPEIKETLRPLVDGKI